MVGMERRKLVKSSHSRIAFSNLIFSGGVSTPNTTIKTKCNNSKLYMDIFSIKYVLSRLKTTFSDFDPEKNLI